jgi:hypothetical protein
VKYIFYNVILVLKCSSLTQPPAMAADLKVGDVAI